MTSTFKPAWWLADPHLQTTWPFLFRLRPRPEFRRQRLELPDGDFLDLDWLGEIAPAHALVLLVHGLEGSSRSHYSRGLSQRLVDSGYVVAVMHLRGCSGEPNRLPRSYHSGETGDLDWVVGALRREYGQLPMAVVGYSLGGNALLKWLGEHPRQQPVDTAVAVSVPFELAKGADRLDSGLSRLYQARLLRHLKQAVGRKLARMEMPIDVEAMQRSRSLRDFDDCVTAPLHGFRDADDYYRQSSSRQYISAIHTPTLILHAQDDPFLVPDAIPGESELGPGVRLEVSRHGGHVGFVSSGELLRPQYWLEERIVQHFDQALEQEDR